MAAESAKPVERPHKTLSINKPIQFQQSGNWFEQVKKMMPGGFGANKYDNEKLVK